MTLMLAKSWHDQLQEELEKPYIQELKKFLSEEKAHGAQIYPPERLVFNALLQTPFDKVKVVIMGQDPYHGPGQAHGLSFSVEHGVKIPPSLQNIYKELQDDLGIPPASHGNLEKWAQQGVLMLNATLTVRAREPKSHYGKGWELFTDAIIEKLFKREDPLIFVLWGKSAYEKVENVIAGRNSPHAVLTAPHPSPYSAHTGFLGCRHFSKINALLKGWGKEPIDWTL